MTPPAVAGYFIKICALHALKVVIEETRQVLNLNLSKWRAFCAHCCVRRNIPEDVTRLRLSENRWAKQVKTEKSKRLQFQLSFRIFVSMCTLSWSHVDYKLLQKPRSRGTKTILQPAACMGGNGH